jgi:hypothetical protein
MAPKLIPAETQGELGERYIISFDICEPRIADRHTDWMELAYDKFLGQTTHDFEIHVHFLWANVKFTMSLNDNDKIILIPVIHHTANSGKYLLPYGSWSFAGKTRTRARLWEPSFATVNRKFMDPKPSISDGILFTRMRVARRKSTSRISINDLATVCEL